VKEERKERRRRVKREPKGIEGKKGETRADGKCKEREKRGRRE
jgi:hypothetical protein